MYSSPCQIAPSLQIAPVFRAGIVVQFGDLALKQFQIEVFKIIQIGSNKTFIESSAKDNFIHSFLQKKTALFLSVVAYVAFFETISESLFQFYQPHFRYFQLESNQSWRFHLPYPI